MSWHRRACGEAHAGTSSFNQPLRHHACPEERGVQQLSPRLCPFSPLPSLTLSRLLQPQGLCMCCLLGPGHTFPRSLRAGSFWSPRFNSDITLSWRFLCPSCPSCTVLHNMTSGHFAYFLHSLPASHPPGNENVAHGLHSCLPRPRARARCSSLKA